jgi:hypothetical protein
MVETGPVTSFSGLKDHDYVVRRLLVAAFTAGFTPESAGLAAHARGETDPLRPGWLSDDTTWRAHLAALDEDDRRFLAESWELAGGKPPALDTSWITMEEIGPHWAWPVVAVAVVFAIAVVVPPILTLTGVLR